MLTTLNNTRVLNKSIEQHDSYDVRMNTQGDVLSDEYKLYTQQDIQQLIKTSEHNKSKYIVIPEFADLSQLDSLGMERKTFIISPNNRLPGSIYNCWVGGNCQIPAFASISNSTFKGVVTALEGEEGKGTIRIKSSIINAIQTSGVVVVHGCAVADILYSGGLKSTESVLQNIATSGVLVLTNNNTIIGENPTIAKTIVVKGGHNILAGVIDESVEFQLEEGGHNNTVVIGQLNKKSLSAVVEAGALNSFNVSNPFDYLVSARKNIIEQTKSDPNLSLNNMNTFDLSNGINRQLDASLNVDLDNNSGLEVF